MLEKVIAQELLSHRGAHQLLPFRGTEDVFQALEDNQVVLSTMKASHFVRAFEKEVDLWERRLSLVMEVIEMILTVQRQWIYLEVRPDPPSGSTPHLGLAAGSPRLRFGSLNL